MFARDPDALLDLIELEVSDDLRVQMENNAVCRVCGAALEAAGKSDEVSQDDLCSQRAAMDACKRLLSGVDYNHPDLKANMWVNPGEIPGNGIDDDGDGYVDDVYGCSTVSDDRFHSGDPMDDHGHGTHVAGIIAA